MNIDKHKENLINYYTRDYSLIFEVKFLDKVQFYHNRSMFEGIITLINNRGCQIYSEKDQYFIKWCNIIKIVN